VLVALTVGGLLVASASGCSEQVEPTTTEHVGDTQESAPASADPAVGGFGVDASTLPTQADLAVIPSLEASEVPVAPFLVMASRAATPTQPPERLIWNEVRSTDVLTLSTAFTPLTATFMGSSEVNDQGIPDVGQQSLAECKREADGRCIFGIEGGHVTMEIPDEIDRSGPVYLIVQLEWDVIDEASPSTFNTIAASYAMHLQP